MSGRVSVSATTYARLTTAARSRGVSVRSLVETALGYLPRPDAYEPREVVAVPHNLYAAAGKIARRRTLPIEAVLEAAILRALDDAEQFPARRSVKRRRPMVAHAARKQFHA